MARSNWKLGGGDVVAKRVYYLGSLEHASNLLGRATVLDVGIVEDVDERAAAVVFPDDVFGDEFLCLRPREEEREGAAEDVRDARHGLSLLSYTR